LSGWLFRIMNWFGVEPRGFAALVRVMILRDLRGQHYAAATAAKAQDIFSPLLIVVGQMLATSVFACALLFARVEVFFFAFVNLSLGLLLLAAAIVVEFQEVVLDPDDLAILGHRPVSPGTYAAARFVNMLFYFVLMYLALNLFPLIVGSGLRDAGAWYLPAYFLASFSGSLILLVLMVLWLSAAGRAEKFVGLRRLLSWAQIISVLVVFYGGQLILRDGTAGLQVWAAFPPEWVQFVPTAWLAWFVERAAAAPDSQVAVWALILTGLTVLVCIVGFIRLSRLYFEMQPSEAPFGRLRPMTPSRIGSLRGWLGRTREERIGYWLCLTFLGRDAGLAMRCAMTFNLAAIALVVGAVHGPFDNPFREGEPLDSLFATMAVFLVPAAAPLLVHNLTYARDSAGGWLLRSAPVANPLGLALGCVKAIFAWMALPLCIVLGTTMSVVWQDPLAGILHALLAAGWMWLMLLASLWLVARAWPFSLPRSRGSSLAIPPLPTIGLGIVICTLASVHALLARFPAYWIASFAAMPVLAWWLRGRAAIHLASLGASSR
jgi:hypothetical protein